MKRPAHEADPSVAADPGGRGPRRSPARGRPARGDRRHDTGPARSRSAAATVDRTVSPPSAEPATAPERADMPVTPGSTDQPARAPRAPRSQISSFARPAAPGRRRPGGSRCRRSAGPPAGLPDQQRARGVVPRQGAPEQHELLRAGSRSRYSRPAQCWPGSTRRAGSRRPSTRSADRRRQEAGHRRAPQPPTAGTARRVRTGAPSRPCAGAGPGRGQRRRPTGRGSSSPPAGRRAAARPSPRTAAARRRSWRCRRPGRPARRRRVPRRCREQPGIVGDGLLTDHHRAGQQPPQPGR